MSQFRSVRNKYDITFSEFIRIRDGCCQMCGKVGRLECSHIHSRKNMGIRCDPTNAKALCNICHRKWHSNPTEATEWLKGVIGEAAYDRLRLKASKPIKLTVFEKDLIRKRQMEDIKKMESGEIVIPCFNKIYR